MKSYFTSIGVWTKAAHEVSRKIDAFLKDIYREEAAKGYSPRELTAITVSSTSMAECLISMELQKADRETKKNEV